MSGIIGGAGSKSGIIDPPANGLKSQTQYHVDVTTTGGDIGGWAKITAGGRADIGDDWTIGSPNSELTPPYLGYWIIGFYQTFYASGDNNNDNAEADVKFYTGGAWGGCMGSRVGDQYDGSYSRGFGYNQVVLKFSDTTNKIKIHLGITNDSLVRNLDLIFTYMGRL